MDPIFQYLTTNVNMMIISHCESKNIPMAMFYHMAIVVVVVVIVGQILIIRAVLLWGFLLTPLNFKQDD